MCENGEYSAIPVGIIYEMYANFQTYFLFCCFLNKYISHIKFEIRILD